MRRKRERENGFLNLGWRKKRDKEKSLKKQFERIAFANLNVNLADVLRGNSVPKNIKIFSKIRR